MPRKGYSKEVVTQMNNPETTGPGVELGRLCLLHNYSISEVAEVYGVSRQTVYNWFTGKNLPNRHFIDKIQTLVDRLKAKPLPEPTTKNE